MRIASPRKKKDGLLYEAGHVLVVLVPHAGHKSREIQCLKDPGTRIHIGHLFTAEALFPGTVIDDFTVRAKFVGIRQTTWGPLPKLLAASQVDNDLNVRDVGWTSEPCPQCASYRESGSRAGSTKRQGRKPGHCLPM